MFMRTLIALCAVALTIPVSGVAATAPVYYVDAEHERASDDNPGSADAPWRTLRRAMSDPLPPGTSVIVRPGRYDASGGTWNRPALNPPSSGTPEQPILFLAEPRHGAILDSGGDDSAIGSFDQDHVVIDGFVVEGGAALGVSVFGRADRRVRGVTIQNMRIAGIRGSGGGNTDGIRVERASGITLRNNHLKDIRNEDLTTNAAGVKIYYSDNIVVENNLVEKAVAGLKEKEEGQGVHVRRNLFRDCGAGMELMNQNDTDTYGYFFYQNIVDGCWNGFIGQTNPHASMEQVYVFNNLFHQYRETGLSGTRYGENRRVWNNIFVPEDARYDLAIHQDPPDEFSLIDFNLYSRAPLTVVGLYTSNRRYEGLPSWQRSTPGFDRHSLVADPLLRDPAAADFRLTADSPARAAGRRDGRPTSETVDLGPYLSEHDTIGPTLPTPR